MHFYRNCELKIGQKAKYIKIFHVYYNYVIESSI